MRNAKTNTLIRYTIFIVLIIFIPLFIAYLGKTRFEAYKLNLFSLPVFITCILILFIAFNRKELLTMRIKPHVKETIIFANLALAAFLAYFWFRYAYHPSFKEPVEFLVLFSYLAYFAGFTLLAASVFGIDFFKKFSNSIFATIILTWIFFQFTLILNSSWKFFSAAIVTSSRFLLGLTFANTAMSLTPGDPTLAVNNFQVVIGNPCSGVESLTMFTILFIGIIAFEWQKINKIRILPFFLIGITGMFAVSILRVYTLMLIGTKYPSFATSMFHTNAGWILFAVYFLAFAYFIYPFITNKNAKKH